MKVFGVERPLTLSPAVVDAEPGAGGTPCTGLTMPAALNCTVVHVLFSLALMSGLSTVPGVTCAYIPLVWAGCDGLSPGYSPGDSVSPPISYHLAP